MYYNKNKTDEKKIYVEVVNYDEVKLSFNDVLYAYILLHAHAHNMYCNITRLYEFIQVYNYT